MESPEQHSSYKSAKAEMKKIVLLFFLLASVAHAQNPACPNTPTTPNLNLCLPLQGATNWGVQIDKNFQIIDAISATGTSKVLNMNFSATPNFDVNKAGIFVMMLTGNITSSTITVPTNGPGRVIDFYFCQTGGPFTVVWPTNFADTPALSTSSTCTGLPFFYGNDNEWHQWASGGGGANPGGADKQLQINKAGGFTGTSGLAVDNSMTPTLLNVALGLNLGGTFNYYVDSGAANAYVITTPFGISSLSSGMIFVFKATNANTASSTLKVDTATAATITKNGGPGGGATLAANDIKAGQVVIVSYDGTNFEIQSQLGNASAGGGGNPASPDACIQINKSSAFGTASGFCLDSSSSPTTLTVPLIENVTGVLNPNGGISSSNPSVSILKDVVHHGPNPYIDGRAYGMRAVSTIINQTGGSCSNGNNQITFGSPPSSFIIGDGIMAVGCGANNTLTAPTGVTVTPELNQGPTGTSYSVPALTGSGTNQYQVSAVHFAGGIGPSSSAVSISTANPLGQQTVSISSATRSNQTMTFNLSSGTQIQAGATVCTTGITEANPSATSFDGCWSIASTTGTPVTSFTALGGSDTRSGASATATSGTGTIIYFQNNHICWNVVSGADQYLVFGRVSGTMVPLALTGPSPTSGTMCWDDYGQSAQNFTSWFPTAPLGSATNDNLISTITNISGNTMTIFDNAGSTNASANVFQDNAKPLKNALAVAASNGTQPGIMQIPAPTSPSQSYIFNGFTDISSLQPVRIQQAGSITMNATMKVPASLTWQAVSGYGLTCPQFCLSYQPAVTANAYPSFYAAANSGPIFNGMSLSVPINGQGIITQGGNPGPSFNDLSCTIGNASDTMGMCITLYSGSQIWIRRGNFIAPVPSLYSTLTPAILHRDNLTGTLGPGFLNIEDTIFKGRGVAVVSNPGVGTTESNFTMRNSYNQGAIQPQWMFSSASPQVANWNLHSNCFVNDTTSSPMIANWGSTTMTVVLDCISPPSGVAMVTGNPVNDLRYTGSNGFPLGQTGFAVDETNGPINPDSPYNAGITASMGQTEFRKPVHVAGQFSMYVNLPAPTNVACAVGANGNVPAGTHVYSVAGISAGGNGEGELGYNASPCVNSSGQQTNTITYNALQGAIGYTTYRDNNAVLACENITSLTCTDSAVSVDNVHTKGRVAGGGVEGMNSGTGLFGHQLVLTSPSPNPVSFKDTVIPGTLTANRTVTLGDESGKACLTGLVGCDFFTDTGTANTYAFCPSPAITAYVTGQQFTFQAANSDTGASTLNVCSLGTRTIKKNGGTGGNVGADLASGDIKAGQIVDVAYDGTNFQMQSLTGNAGGGGGGTVTTTGSPASGNLAAFSGATSITKTDLSGDVTTSGTSATTVAKIQGIPVATASVAAGQILNVVTGPQYVNQYPGVNYNPQTTDYSIACPGDRFGYVDFTGSAAHTFTLPQAGSTACMGSSFGVLVANHSNPPAVLTLLATTSTIDGVPGATGLVINSGAARFVYSDNTNFHTVHVSASTGGVNKQTTSYTASLVDWNVLVVMQCASACTFTLPNPIPTNKYRVKVISTGAALATVSLNGLTFNGSTSVPVLIGFQEQDFNSDGANWFGQAPLFAGTNVTFTPASNSLAISSSGGGGGSGPTIQTNGTPNTDQTVLNFVTTTGIKGITPTLTGTNQETFNLTATVQGSDTNLLSSATLAGTAGCLLLEDANFGTSDGNCDFTYLTHTLAGGASAIFDMSAATGANAMKVPVQAGCTAGANGDICYDSTNKNTHVRTNAADSIVGAFASVPTTAHLVDVTVTAGNTLLHDSGVATSAIVTTTANMVNGNLPVATGAQTLADSAISTSGSAFTNIGGQSLTGTFGVTVIPAKASSTGNTAPITTTNLIASAAAGEYRISGYVVITTAGSGGTSPKLALTLGWNDGQSSQTVSAQTADVNANRFISLSQFVHSGSAQAITYATSISGAPTTNPTYSIYLIAERMN